MAGIKRILIVDDEAQTSDILKEMLSILYPDSQITEINHSKGAAEAFQKEKFELIFSDHLMPHKTGVELVKELREGSSPNQNTPVLMVTAQLEEALVQIGSLDHTRVIDKPVTLDKIKDNLRVLLKE